jgi:molybdenum cofactor biosynthesis enzyme MoaA
MTTKVTDSDNYMEEYCDIPENSNALKPLPKLRVTIIDKCQLKCVFCGGNGFPMENFQPDYMQGRLPFDILHRILKKYVDHGGLQIQFTGGEPLLHPNIAELIQCVIESGGIPEVNTNGVALTEKKVKELSEAGLTTIKVSIPTLDTNQFKCITGINALEKVLNNAKHAMKFLNVRITMVPIQSSLNSLLKSIEFFRHTLKVKQVTLLELLYYPHISSESKLFFTNEYVDLLASVAPQIETLLNSRFKKYHYLTKTEKNLYFIESPDDGFKVFIKQALRTLRSKECHSCNHFCQEGLYEMRLSLAGWLSACNIPNEYGVDLSKKDNLDMIDEHMKRFKKMFAHTTFCKFSEFFKHHKLDHYIDR